MDIEPFTDQQIAVLRAADDALPHRPKLTQSKIHEMFQGMPDQLVIQLAQAGFRYLSAAAHYEMILRGGGGMVHSQN